MGAACCGPRDVKSNTVPAANPTNHTGGEHSQPTHEPPVPKKKITTDRKLPYLIEPKVYIAIVKGSLQDYYKIESTLYQSTISHVLRVRHLRTANEYAVKIILKDSVHKAPNQRLFEEAAILATLDHPNIVALYEIFEDDLNYYEILEYAPGGEALAKIKESKEGIAEYAAADYMRQLLSAVAYLHSKGIIHRGIMPENLMLGAGFETYTNLKLIGFGTARAFGAEKLTEKVEINFFTAPEVLDNSYNEKCDEWSCGAFCYTLLSGRMPFTGGAKKDLSSSIKHAKYSFDGEKWKGISEDAKDFIKKLMTVDPASRITAAEALQHPWIKKNASELKFQVENIKNLRDFTSANTFQLAVMQFIATRVLDKFKKDGISETFQKFDEDGDGRITKEDLIRVFKETLGEDDHQAAAEKVFSQIDSNKSGGISYSEYVLAALPRDVILTTDNINKVFDIFDADGDGKINKNELAVKFPGLSQVDKAIDKLFASVDLNSDNKISRQELTDLVLEQESAN